MEEFIADEGGFAKGNRLRMATLGLLFLGIFILALGAGIYYFENNRGEEVKIISGGADATPMGELVVHVDGAIVNPGVYKLASGSRVSDVVEKAGGLSEEADRGKVNLATKLTDGQKLLIPNKTQSSNIPYRVNKTQNSGEVAGALNLININDASASQLDTLPGVGTVTAGKIISGRPYSDINELTLRKVVTSSVFEKIKDLISTN